MKEAFVVGEREPPLIENTIGDYFDKQVAKYGDNTALIVNYQV